MEKIKLICFDLDETLIDHNSWKELGFALGISYEEDKRLFDEYEAGKLTYEKWNNKVLEYYLMHEDATLDGITRILSKYKYVDGAREAVEYLKQRGYILVLISGSVSILVSMVAEELGIKYFKANSDFVFDDSGRIKAIHTYGDDKMAKANHLEAFCDMLNIDIKNCACIADGANDIEMFRRTGHGVTFKGTKIEKEAWKVVDSFTDLQKIFI